VAAGVEGDGAEAGGEDEAGEIVVALLARPGTVEDDDPALGRALVRREPQGVGEAGHAPDLAREGHLCVPQPRHRPMMPGSWHDRPPWRRPRSSPTSFRSVRGSTTADGSRSAAATPWSS